MLHFVKGNMFNEQFDVRINAVNCVGVMERGIALSFKERYLNMFSEYKRECAMGRVKPGLLHIYHAEDCEIVNLPTKRHWREASRYEDIEVGLVALRTHLLTLGKVKVAIPPLGCGCGGLDWNRIKIMIQKYLGNID